MNTNENINTEATNEQNFSIDKIIPELLGSAMSFLSQPSMPRCQSKTVTNISVNIINMNHRPKGFFGRLMDKITGR